MLENMLDYIRITLYTLMMLLGFLLYQAWEKEHPPLERPAAPPQVQTLSARNIPDVPQVASQAAVQTSSAPAISVPSVPALNGKIITVTTDVLEAKIDTLGGEIVEVKLLKYPESLGTKTPFVLLNDNPNTRYVAESGLLGPKGPDTSESQAIYTGTQTQYVLNPKDNSLTVSLDWQNKEGLKVTKLFTFKRDSYEIDMGYEIDNQSKAPWQGNLYAQLARTNSPPANHGGIVNLTTFFGAAVSTERKTFEKISFPSMHKQALSEVSKDGWAAMVQHYFIGAWVPKATDTSHYYSKVTPNGLYTIGLIGDQIVVPANAKASTEAKLYAGPAITERLRNAAPGLQLTVDYGWFWFISVIIFWMMQKIFNIVGNWGWSIVLVTIIIKLLFYHLSAKSYRSMSALKRLQPRLATLKERYGDDKQKFTQATMELYRQEKVNPMSGCLPVLVQIPVFIALYWVLVESVELRQAPFIFWIRDLSQSDPYFILPLLMGISMFIQQRLSPPPPDPLQAKVMMLMPVVFTVLFANFPAGLMLYWVVNNTLSFLQQWYIMHKLEKEQSAVIKK
jgi:YidC/Oxa1 family membrane protein insertase